MQLLIPHLWYNTEAKQAASLYTQLLPDSGIDWIHTVTDTPSGDAELIQFHLGDTTLAAISAGPYVKLNESASLMLDLSSKEEVDRLYQAHSEELAKELESILLEPSSEKLLVCLPDVFQNLERYNHNARHFWQEHFKQYGDFYREKCRSFFYGSTFLSRPYIDLEDKSVSDTYFAAVRSLWQDRDILIVEGETARSGSGNDLFANAKSVSRIICPAKDASSHYQEIKEAVFHHANQRLVLLMLGPTVKLLARDLATADYQAIDLGHIDSEYEWFQMKAQSKVKLSHKHTAEYNFDEEIHFADDQEYEGQILECVGVGVQEMEHHRDQQTDGPLISIVVPVYNVKPYLSHCLDSLLKQTYSKWELLLINDGSTDSSGAVCQTYAELDPRIRLFHQENQGVSAARNKGLDQDKGDYITFVNSDDFVAETYLEEVLDAALEYQVDIAATNFTSFNEERQSFLFYHHEENDFQTVYSVQEWLNLEGDMANNMHLAFTFSLLKLFKTHLFEGIRYPVGRLREDDATLYKVYLKANAIHFCNHGPYYYSQRRDGLSRTGMLEDISGMITNAEERLALLVAMGYDVQAQIASYKARLKKCQADALYDGQIELYHSLTAKLNLIEYHGKGEWRWT